MSDERSNHQRDTGKNSSGDAPPPNSTSIKSHRTRLVARRVSTTAAAVSSTRRRIPERRLLTNNRINIPPLIHQLILSPIPPQQSAYLNTIDLVRHRADSRSNYEAYFAIIGQKIEEYKISADNIYKMDEKGFLIGKLQKSRRVFTRELYERSSLAGAGQDGSREWITVAATICADGTRLSPALIYKAISGNLQDTWLNEFEPEEHDCHFASPPNGWTSDELGYSWLTGLFEKETASKARRSHRLSFVDGHGSHVNMKFLDWCEQHKVLLAVYPPHSTHRLQPLDVGVFAPLASYYSQALDDLVRKSEGHTGISKRDVFSLFWPA